LSYNPSTAHSANIAFNKKLILDFSSFFCNKTLAMQF
jgi:hypothetical protein